MVQDNASKLLNDALQAWFLSPGGQH